jgi:hypothetical protein
MAGRQEQSRANEEKEKGTAEGDENAEREGKEG